MLEKLNVDSAKFLGLSNGGRVISKIADINPSIVERLVYVASSGFKYIDELNDKSVSKIEVSNFIKKNYPTISRANYQILNILKNILDGILNMKNCLNTKDLQRL